MNGPSHSDREASHASPHQLDHEPFLVSPDKSLRLADHDPGYTAGLKDKKEGRAALIEDVEALAAAQELLWASAQHSVLIILQALDAAGKDGAIKHVMSGVNPQGVDVHAFKAPNEQEVLHHFLWRAIRKMPERGRIGIFNRSYYEEVLIVRVHPSFLQRQSLPEPFDQAPYDNLWEQRFQEINDFERVASANNVTIIKFFLNISKGEQRKRFLKRLRKPEKHWKFSAADLRERDYWNDYQRAYEEMLNATSTEHAPWYIIPADHKWFARAAIADVVTTRIDQLHLTPPQLSEDQMRELKQAREKLEAES